MATTPARAKELAASNSITELETRIDAWIESEFRHGKRRVFFNTSSIYQPQIDLIVIRYRQAGWKVTHGSDRDGPHLIFEEA